MQPSETFAFGDKPPRRRPSLTPMVDVVFLLLVFFMLAARFGLDAAVPIGPSLGGDGTYQGAPRLVAISPTGVRLNGAPMSVEALPAALQRLMPTPDSVVVVQPADGATVQHLVDVLDHLRAAGISRIALVE